MTHRVVSDCADEEVLCALFEGRLRERDARVLDAHVATCRPCRELLVELASMAVVSDDDDTRGRIRSGTRIGRYVVRELVGVGAMSVVYAAHDPDLDRSVALKLLRTDVAHGSEVVATLVHHEARAIARVSHPNVIAVYDVGMHGDRVFMAMELVPGQTLREWLPEAAERPIAEVLRTFIAAGRGLAAAHANGVVHRDFKPDNVLVASDGRIKVADFGLARARVDALPADAIIGTPAYMAPEQRDGGRSDARSDQYSFCVALHEALRARDAAPPRLLAIVERGFAANPDERYASMDALLDTMEMSGRRPWRAMARRARRPRPKMPRSRG